MDIVEQHVDKNNEHIKNIEKDIDDNKKIKFTYDLTKYLFNYFFESEEKLNFEEPTKEELNNIKKFYLGILEENINIRDIEEYQNNFIISELQIIMDNLEDKKLQTFINNRINKIRELICNLK